MEPMKSVAEQIREQSGGTAPAAFKQLILWVLIFSAATLLWWEIDRLAGLGSDLLAGWGWTVAPWWALTWAICGLVLAMGFAAVSVMTSGALMAIPCTVLLFAPMALFDLWQPLWIWWILGPLAALVLISFCGIAGEAGGRAGWRPSSVILSNTLWVLVLTWFASAFVTSQALEGVEDRLQPSDFERVARFLVDRAPEGTAEMLLSELPQTSAVAPPPLERTTPPAPETQPTEATPEEVGPAPAPAPAPSPFALPRGPRSPYSVISPETQGGGAKQFGVPPATPPSPSPATPAPPFPTTPPPAEPQPSMELPQPPSDTVTLPTPAETPPSAELTGEETEELVDALALGLWHAVSTHGEGYGMMGPALPVVGGLIVWLAMIPMIVLGMLVSLIVMVGIILNLMSATGFMRKITVRIEVPRCTLRPPGQSLDL
ncbi:hypothetical protein JXA47_01360 [Candidatus Sumerlaeota bacterium]|nr:hypothetical protein [Candidatus Sumerlaeota bacterium]